MTGMNGKPIGKGTKKVIEKVEYKGEYRIVGTVWNGKDNVGFAVVDIKTYAMRLFTTVQTRELLTRFKFENAELIANEVKNTECSMDRLIKFDTQNNVIGNAGITILGKLFDDKEKVLGFRVMDANGKVIDISENDIVQLVKRNRFGLINAKSVPTQTGLFISAIKGNFKRIEKLAVEVEKEIEANTKKNAEWVKGQHKIYLEKALWKFFRELLVYGGVKPIKNNSRKKMAQIVSKEFILVHYPQLKQAKDSKAEDIITAALLGYLCEHGVYTTSRGSSTVRLKANYRNNIVDRIHGRDVAKFNVIDKTLMNVLKEIDNTGDAFKFALYRNHILEGKIYKVDDTVFIKNDSILLTLLSFRNTRYHRNQKIEKLGRSKNGFHTGDIDFKDTSGLAELGYTTDPNQIGVDFDSIVYGKKPLRWYLLGLERLNQYDETLLADNINSFGDIELLRNISKSLKGNEKGRIWAEELLFVLAMHNPTVANIANRINGNFSDLDIDAISKENYFLSAEDIIFYESGGKFNRLTKLERGESWGYLGLSKIPQATYEAISINLGPKLGQSLFQSKPYW